MLEDAGIVRRGKDAQRRPVHLEAEVFELMTAWIERYRKRVEARYRRLDRLLAASTEGRELSIRQRYERAADGFGARIMAMTPAGWEADSPCEGWTGRGVLDHVIEMTVAATIEMVVTSDLAIHTWDLARAGGLDDTIDPDLIEWMPPMTHSTDAATEQAMRSNGQFGPRIDVDETADSQTRVLAFFGRAG